MMMRVVRVIGMGRRGMEAGVRVTGKCAKNVRRVMGMVAGSKGRDGMVEGQLGRMG